MLASLAVEPPAENQSTAEDASKRVLKAYVAAVIRRCGIDGTQVPADAPEPVRRWLAANREVLVGVRQIDQLSQQPWGFVAQGRAANGGKRSPLYLYVFDRHASGTLVVYGLTGGVGKAYVFGQETKADLVGVRVGRSIRYTIPKESWDPLTTVIVLEMKGELETSSLVTAPAPDGTNVLHARDALVHGHVARYEPEPHKNTIGYWTDPNDWVSWQFEIAKAGEYRVDILQGCGKGSGGSRVDFSCGDQVLTVTVEDTGSFQNFVSRDIGRLRFDKAGRYTLEVKPRDKPGVAVMDLRQVTLTPVRE